MPVGAIIWRPGSPERAGRSHAHQIRVACGNYTYVCPMVSTLCGHSTISHSLAKKMIDFVKENRCPR